MYWLAETQGERLSNHVFCNRFLGSLQAIAPLHTGVRIRFGCFRALWTFGRRPRKQIHRA